MKKIYFQQTKMDAPGVWYARNAEEGERLDHHYVIKAVIPGALFRRVTGHTSYARQTRGRAMEGMTKSELKQLAEEANLLSKDGYLDRARASWYTKVELIDVIWQRLPFYQG